MNTNPNIVTAEVALEVQFLRATLRFEVQAADYPFLLEQFEPDLAVLQAQLPVILGEVAPEMLNQLHQSVSQRLRDAHWHQFSLSRGLLKTPAEPASSQPITEGQS